MRDLKNKGSRLLRIKEMTHDKDGGIDEHESLLGTCETQEIQHGQR